MNLKQALCRSIDITIHWEPGPWFRLPLPKLRVARCYSDILGNSRACLVGGTFEENSICWESLIVILSIVVFEVFGVSYLINMIQTFSLLKWSNCHFKPIKISNRWMFCLEDIWICHFSAFEMSTKRQHSEY